MEKIKQKKAATPWGCGSYMVPAGGIEGKPLSNNELHDFGQTHAQGGHDLSYPGNVREDGSRDNVDVRTNFGAMPPSQAQQRTPKIAQALPKSSPSFLAEETTQNPDNVSIYFDELSEIAKAWPMLSDDLRTGIMTIVRATSQKSGSE